MSLLPDEYYLENGLMVFTERYHQRRGYCCGNGCRHCPYQFESVAPEKRAQLKAPCTYFQSEEEQAPNS